MPESKKYVNYGAVSAFSWLFTALFLSLLWPVSAAARPASFYQKDLNPAARRQLAGVQELSRRGEFEKALRKLDKFIQIKYQDENPPLLLDFVAANLNFQLDKFSQAVLLYRQVVQQAPEFSQAWENYGLALFLAEEYKIAAKILLHAAEMRPQKARKLKYRAAIASLYGGELVKARALLLELTEFPESRAAGDAAARPPVAWLKALMQVDWQLSDYKAAAAAAKKLVDIYPAEVGHWRLYSQAALAAAELNQALSACKVLQNAGGLSPKECKMTAQIYQQLNLYQEAAEILEDSLEESQTEIQDLKQLSALYRQTGQVEKALAALNRLEKLAPDNSNLFQIGEILYSAGRYQEAAQVFLSLDKITKNDGRQYLMAGYCAWNTDDFKSAAAAWQKAAAYPSLKKQALNLLQTLKPWLEAEKNPVRENDDFN